LRLFSFGGYGLALAVLALVDFGAYDSYPNYFTGPLTNSINKRYDLDMGVAGRHPGGGGGRRGHICTRQTRYWITLCAERVHYSVAGSSCIGGSCENENAWLLTSGTGKMSPAKALRLPNIVLESFPGRLEFAG